MSSLEEVKNHVYSFEKLNVWQLAIELAKHIYKITTEFPKEELYGLSLQLFYKRTGKIFGSCLWKFNGSPKPAYNSQ